MVRAIDLLFRGDPEERFEFGLDPIIRGLESYAGTDSAPARARE